jgi:hypothetical protein
MNNVYSCRRIAREMLHDIYYMWLSGNEHPSYSTINRFRSEHVKDQVNSLFVQVVKSLVEMGVLSLDVQYIDGTKVESVANKYTFVWRKTVERNKAKLEKKILGVLRQIEEGIAQDNSEEPESEPVAIDSASLQGIVDKINAENATMPDFLSRHEQAYGAFPKKAVADSGYGSEENYEFMEANDVEAFVKYPLFHKEQHRPFLQDISRPENLHYNEEEDYYVCPIGQRMHNIGTYRRKNDNGYTSYITYY